MPSTALETPGSQQCRAFFDTLIAVGAEEVKLSLGANSELAEQAMFAIASRLCSHYRGQTIYVSKALAVGWSPRNDEIVRKYSEPAELHGGSKPFSMERVDALASSYSLTRRSIYSILKMSRERSKQGRCGSTVAPEAAAAVT